MKFYQNGATEIQQIINKAVEKELFCATVTGNWEIEKTILLPSGFTLILENCYLRMADGTFCNMFANANSRTQAGRMQEGTDRDIRIEGRGRVILTAENIMVFQNVLMTRRMDRILLQIVYCFLLMWMVSPSVIFISEISDIGQ